MKIQFVQANPGFFVIDNVSDETGKGIVDFILDPVIAWGIDVDISEKEEIACGAYPVSLEPRIGRTYKVPILKPDGRVVIPDNTEYDSIEEYGRDVGCLKYVNEPSQS